MKKNCYRFFGGLLTLQENWLNRMADNGYRLVRTGKLLYGFESCAPGQYQYRVEFVGEKSREGAEDYARFLEDCGYSVFFKNINLDYSIGKVKWRPWAEPGGRVAARATTYDRELLIVEKARDGKPFELHTTYEDRLLYYRNLRKPWLWLLGMSVVFGSVMRAWVWGIFAILSLFPLAAYQAELAKLKKQAVAKEW